MSGSETENGAGPGSARPGRWYQGAAVLGLFGALVVAVRPILTPFVLYGLLLYVAWPRLSVPVYARLTAAGGVLLALWILEVTGLLLGPFLLAVILAYVFDPAVDVLERRMPRPAAIGLLALPMAGLAVLAVVVVAPAVGRQVSELISHVPAWLRAVEGWLGELRAWVIGLGLEGINEQTVPRLADIDAQAVAEYLHERRRELTRTGMDAVLGLGRGLGVALSLAGYLVLLPVLTYYLLRDWDRVAATVLGLVPPAHRSAVEAFARRYDHLLNRYLRGQLVMAALVGLMIGVGFWIVDFPFALLLGLVAGVFNIVPYVGFALSLAAAVLIAVLSGSPMTALLKVAAVYGVEQVGEGILAPRIVGESVGLHPVWVLLALTLFGFFFGFVGLLLAVPAAVLVKLALEEALRRYRRSVWYREGLWPSEPEADPAAGDGEEGA